MEDFPSNICKSSRQDTTVTHTVTLDSQRSLVLPNCKQANHSPLHSNASRFRQKLGRRVSFNKEPRGSGRKSPEKPEARFRSRGNKGAGSARQPLPSWPAAPAHPGNCTGGRAGARISAAADESFIGPARGMRPWRRTRLAARLPISADARDENGVGSCTPARASRDRYAQSARPPNPPTTFSANRGASFVLPRRRLCGTAWPARGARAAGSAEGKDSAGCLVGRVTAHSRYAPEGMYARGDPWNDSVVNDGFLHIVYEYVGYFLLFYEDFCY